MTAYRRMFRAAFVAGAITLTTAPAALAGPWLPAQRVTNPGQDIGDGQITVGARGALASTSTVAGADGYLRIRVAVREAGVTPLGTGRFFGDLTTVSGPLPTGSTYETAIDDAGNVIVFWTPYFWNDQTYNKVGVRIKPAGKPWLPAQELSELYPSYNAKNTIPEFAWSPNGNAVVSTPEGLWERKPGSDTFVAVPNTSEVEHIAMNDAGDLAAGFYIGEASGIGYTNPYEVRTRPAGGSWSTKALGAVSRDYPYEASRSSLTITDDGTVVTAWVAGDNSGSSDAGLKLAVRKPGSTFASGTWSPTEALNALDPYSNRTEPKLEVSQPGTVKVSWIEPRYDGAPDDQRSKTVSTAPADVLPAAEASAVSFAAGGRSILLPPVAQRPAGTITARARPKYGDPFGAETTLVAPAGTAKSYATKAVGLDGQGNGLVVWDRTIQEPGKPETHLIGVSGYDPVAPVVTSFTAPATGTVGQAVAFSAAATDRLSAPALTWTFGDGATATGASVSRTYAQPGTYTVRVTATDDAGNTATKTGSIVISAAQKVSANPQLWTPSYAGGRTLVRTLELSSVRAGDSVKLACTGGGCTPELNRTFTVGATAAKLVTAFNGSAGISLAAGAKLVVTIGRTGWAPQTATFTTRAYTSPTRVLG